MITSTPNVPTSIVKIETDKQNYLLLGTEVEKNLTLVTLFVIRNHDCGWRNVSNSLLRALVALSQGT